MQATPFNQEKLVKPVLFLLALLPFLRLIFLIATEQLGANPVEFITRDTGNWTLYLLCATLSVTPLRRVDGWHTILKSRRMLGLFAFFYACLHFLAFLWFEHFFDVTEMGRDVLERPFIAVGFAAFLLLRPLAATSNKVAIRRLGRRWQVLHRLIYLIVLLALLHFWWMRAGKQDFADPALWGGVVAVLLGLRIYWRYAQPRRSIPS